MIKVAKSCTPLLFPRPQDIVLSTVLDAKCAHIYMYSLCFHLCEVGRDAVVLLYLWTMWSLWSLWSLSNWRESSGRQQVGPCRASFHSLLNGTLSLKRYCASAVPSTPCSSLMRSYSAEGEQLQCVANNCNALRTIAMHVMRTIAMRCEQLQCM